MFEYQYHVCCKELGSIWVELDCIAKMREEFSAYPKLDYQTDVAWILKASRHVYYERMLILWQKSENLILRLDVLNLFMPNDISLS